MTSLLSEPHLDVAAPGSARPAAGSGVVDFRLDNGLTVVVIPDRRAPVVTHMVWYRNGSADDPLGKSGIAHFLEHLMFKGTKAHPQGEFSLRIAEIGGQENAFTSNDYTAYFQRVAKEHLGAMMEFEADRMTGLVLTDEIVAPERDVVLEERRMHCDADPSAQLNEAVQAALFTHHPYGTPIIGWGHEIESLDREDALAYYARFYTPENAILIVAGDTDAEEVRRLAEQHYGKIRPRGAAPERHRPQEPAPVARRLVVVNDEKVEQPSWQRCYLAPSHRTAAPGESEALDVLAHLLGGGQTSLLYRKLVLEDRPSGRGGRLLHGLGLGRDAVLSLRHAGSRRLAARSRRRGRSRPRVLPRRRRRRRKRWSAPRPASSPTRSTRRTARRRWRAGMARRSPPGRRSATSRNGRRASRR